MAFILSFINITVGSKVIREGMTQTQTL